MSFENGSMPREIECHVYLKGIFLQRHVKHFLQKVSADTRGPLSHDRFCVKNEPKTGTVHTSSVMNRRLWLIEVEAFGSEGRYNPKGQNGAAWPYYRQLHTERGH